MRGRRLNLFPCYSFAWGISAEVRLRRACLEIWSGSGLDSKFNSDSAGTIRYHEGNPADSRMRAASQKHGIAVTSISRPIRASNFRDFDLILAMDKQNKEDILEAFERWRFRDNLPADGHKKVKLMCSYCKQHRETEVPDFVAVGANVKPLLLSCNCYII
ncbi:hypothetical protein QQ045_012221 [Rhodiola kirilowii]